MVTQLGGITVTDASPPVVVTVQLASPDGQLVPAKSTPTWVSSNVEVATIVASEDGESATITPLAEGVTTITMDVDDLHCEGQVIVTPSVMASLTFTVPDS